MDSTPLGAQPDSSRSRTSGPLLDDAAAIASALHWLAEHYAMSNASAQILLTQLARQDGVTEAVAARSLPTTGTEAGPTTPVS